MSANAFPNPGQGPAGPTPNTGIGGITWLPTEPVVAKVLRRRMLPMLLLIVVFLPLLFFAGLTINPLAGILFVFIFGGLFLALLLRLPNPAPLSIGIAPEGVIVKRQASETRAYWAQIQPGNGVVFQSVVWFIIYAPGGSVRASGFATSLAQARAIVLSPYAPPWVLSLPLATALGVPAQRPPAPGAQVPPQPPISTTPAYATAPAAPLPSYSPPPNPGAYYQQQSAAPPVGPAYAPPARPAAPTLPPPPPPGTIQCKKCGMANPSEGVAFCRSCGQRLR